MLVTFVLLHAFLLPRLVILDLFYFGISEILSLCHTTVVSGSVFECSICEYSAEATLTILTDLSASHTTGSVVLIECTSLSSLLMEN